MSKDTKSELLRKIPSVSDLLARPSAAAWLKRHPRALVTECLRRRAEELRQADPERHRRALRAGARHAEAVLARAEAIAGRPHHAAAPRRDQRHRHHPAHRPGPGRLARVRGGLDGRRT